ncbi:hypothetical protein A0H81_02173 [Grifola frondosa]|uniref:Uncharacterized protein n=1 Tax=Grifola frondosa TaxID=5627 RepID=A0A1C7MLQ7_GRIFR|nr:hypothetical protein A0H81_02173 [Grifola frondosa]
MTTRARTCKDVGSAKPAKKAKLAEDTLLPTHLDHSSTQSSDDDVRNGQKLINADMTSPTQANKEPEPTPPPPPVHDVTSPTEQSNARSHSPILGPPPENIHSASSSTSPIPPPPRPIRNRQSGYFADFITRVSAFLTYADNRAGRFSPTKEPNGLAWGTPTILWDDLDKYLCLKKKPVTWWLVGRAKALWFFDNSGTPYDRASVGICPIRPIDWQACRHLINDYAHPKTSAHSRDMPDPIYAGKLMKSRTKNETVATASGICAFERVYDATERFGPKSSMSTINATAIAKNDIVLVECYLTRWRLGETKYSKAWDAWKCGFQLHTVALLYSAPDVSKDLELDVDEELKFIPTLHVQFELFVPTVNDIPSYAHVHTDNQYIQPLEHRFE